MGETKVLGKHKLVFYLKVSAIDINLIIPTSVYYQMMLAGLNQILFLVNDATLVA